MGGISIFHWIILLMIIGVPVVLIIALLKRKK